MERPPRPRGERLVNRSLIMRSMVLLGGIQAVVAMAAFFFLYWTYGWQPGTNMFTLGAVAAGGSTVYILATTMTHGAVVTTQIGNAFAQRTNVQSVFKIGIFSNRLLLWGILAEMLMFCALVYVPFLADIFHHGPINLWPDWAFLIMLTPLLLVADEVRKWVLRRRIAQRALHE
jgi:Ca2+-transporting ATPase